MTDCGLLVYKLNSILNVFTTDLYIVLGYTVPTDLKYYCGLTVRVVFLHT